MIDLDADLPLTLAVIVTVPALRPLTLPLASTVATAELLEDQETLLVALLGVKEAVNLIEEPTATSLAPEIETPVAGTSSVDTVTRQVEENLPSLDLTVIVVEPALIALTLPLASTVATSVSLEIHSRSSRETPSGNKEILIFFVPLIVNVKLVESSPILLANQ